METQILLSRREAAHALSTTTNRINRWVRDGSLTHVVLPDGQVKVRPTDLEAFAERHLVLVQGEDAKEASRDEEVWPDDDQGFVESLIRNKARKFIARSGTCFGDESDIQQKLRIELWTSLDGFDPIQGRWPAYASVVVRRALAKIRRDGTALKRGPTNIASINANLTDRDGNTRELAQTVSTSEAIHRSASSLDHCSRVDLRIDLEEATVGLPDEYWKFIELRKDHSMQAASEELGVPRTTLYGWTKTIRKRFEKAGLEAYLDNAPSLANQTGK